MKLSAHQIKTRLRAANPWTLIIAVLLLVLFIGLSIRAADEYRWSDWGFGDAQTMLSLRQWEEGGWFQNYLLFKPQGYATVIDVLDEPELRQHAHGTCPGSSPRVGPRLWYTHYPAGYLIPYAVLFKLGLDSLFSVRMLSILFSMGALVLMYLLFAKITSPRVSFAAVLFYGLSAPFLGYADSLANQPIDDLLRFGFMFAVVMTTRADSARHRKNWLVAAWILEFCLSLTSFDSVFFLYAWLIGWDWIEKKGFQWRKYLLFALAPVSAHSLQFLQNVWYLGWEDAVIDIKDAFLLKNGADQRYNYGQGRLSVIGVSLVVLFKNIFGSGVVIAAAAFVYGVFALVLRKENRELPSLPVLSVLFLSGLAFVLVLPHAARMPYEARQMLPCISLLAAGLTWSVPVIFRKIVHGNNATGEAALPAPQLWVALPYLVVSLVLLLIVWSRFAAADRTPVYDLGNKKWEMQFAQELTRLKTRYEPVFFDVGAFSLFWDPAYVPGYPQILPLTEYYAGSSPILCFNDAGRAVRDLGTMIAKSSGHFSPVLISRDMRTLEEATALLHRDGLIFGQPALMSWMGRYAIDLTDHLNWAAFVNIQSPPAWGR